MNRRETLLILSLVIISGIALIPTSSPTVEAAEGDNPNTFEQGATNTITWTYSDTIRERSRWSTDVRTMENVGEVENGSAPSGYSTVWGSQVTGYDNNESIGDSVYMWIPQDVEGVFADSIGLAENAVVSWIYLEDESLCAAIRSGSVRIFNESYYYNEDNITQAELNELINELTEVKISLDIAEGKWVYKYEWENQSGPGKYEIEIEIEEGENTKITTSGEAMADGTHEFVGALKEVNAGFRKTEWKSGRNSISWAVTSETNWDDNTDSAENTHITSGGQLVLDGWYDNDWAYRKQILIEKEYVENADLTDFPMLIVITLDNAKTMDNAQDIAFTASDGTTKLDHELENFDTETLVAWVRIPTLTYNADTIIYVYYGNASAVEQENPEGVWDDNFMAVWHLVEDAGTFYDSTSNNNDTTAETVTRTSPSKIGDGCEFDGATEKLSVADSASLDITENITLEAWVEIDDTGDTHNYVVDKVWGGGADWNYSFNMYQAKPTLQYDTAGDSEEYYQCDTAITTSWAYVAVTFEFDGTIHNANTYINGNLLVGTWIAGNGDTVPAAGAGDLGIGVGKYAAPVAWFNGEMDEVRISNSMRDANWIKTKYEIEDDPTNAITVGAEVTKFTGGLWTSVVWDNQAALKQNVDNLIISSSIGLIASYDISAKATQPVGIEQDGTEWWILTDISSPEFMEYSDAFVYQDEDTLSDTAAARGFAYVDAAVTGESYVSLYVADGNSIDNYENSATPGTGVVYKSTTSVSSQMGTAADVYYYPTGGEFYVLDYNLANDDVYLYDNDFSYTTTSWNITWDINKTGTDYMNGLHYRSGEPRWYILSQNDGRLRVYDNDFTFERVGMNFSADDSSPTDMYYSEAAESAAEGWWVTGDATDSVYHYADTYNEQIWVWIASDTDNDGDCGDTPGSDNTGWMVMYDNGYLLDAGENLDPGYQFQVGFKLDTNDIEFSPAIANFTLRTSDANQKPDTPENLAPTISVKDNTDIDLYAQSWDDDGDAFTLYFHDTSDDSLIGSVAAVNNGDNATVNWAGLTPGSTYSFRVYADDGTDTSDNSATVTFKINTRPDKPENLAPIAFSPSGTEAFLYAQSWDDDGDEFRLYFHDNAAGAFIGSVGGLTNGDNLPVTWYGVSSSTVYHFTVWAEDNFGDKSDNSDLAGFRVNGLPVVEYLEIENENGPTRLITLTPEFDWQPSDPDSNALDNWQIRVGTDNTFSNDNDMWDNYGADNENYILYAGHTLSRGVMYHVAVRVRDNNGEWSNWDNDNFQINQIPACDNMVVENLENFYSHTNFTPVLAWDYADSDGDTQSRHLLRVGTTPNGNEMWGIETTITADNFITYAGLPLSRGVLYYWDHQVWDGYESCVYMTAEFMMDNHTDTGINNPDDNTTFTAGYNISFDVVQEFIDNGYSFSWDFDDGETSTDANTTHTYGNPGIYTITLTVTTGGVDDIYEITITIVAPDGAGAPSGGPGGVPAAPPTEQLSQFLAEYVEPADNVLFFTAFSLFGVNVAVWMIFAVITVWAWYGGKRRRGILKACLLIWPFLIFFGSRLMPGV